MYWLHFKLSQNCSFFLMYFYWNFCSWIFSLRWVTGAAVLDCKIIDCLAEWIISYRYFIFCLLNVPIRLVTWECLRHNLKGTERGYYQPLSPASPLQEKWHISKFHAGTTSNPEQDATFWWVLQEPAPGAWTKAESSCSSHLSSDHQYPRNQWRTWFLPSFLSLANHSWRLGRWLSLQSTQSIERTWRILKPS